MANNSGVIVKLMFCYGGRFVAHPIDVGRFVYVGGESKLTKVNRRVTFFDLVMTVRRLGNITEEFYMQYQLPGFDKLVTIYNSDDSIESMMRDYDHKVLNNPSLPKRIRLFLFYYPKSQPGDLLSYWDSSSWWTSLAALSPSSRKGADGTDNDREKNQLQKNDLDMDYYNFNMLRIG